MCGAEVAAEAKSCGSCGTIVVPPSEPPPPVLAPTPPKKGARNIIALAMLVVALAGLTLILRGGGNSNAAMDPEQLRQARAELEAEWDERRDEYFALAARVDLVEKEDMDSRRVIIKPGAWSKLDASEQKTIVDLLALKTSVRLSEAKRGRIEVVEGSRVVARFEPGRGVSLD
jgi:hypothetical protein